MKKQFRLRSGPEVPFSRMGYYFMDAMIRKEFMPSTA